MRDLIIGCSKESSFVKINLHFAETSLAEHLLDCFSTLTDANVV